MMTIEALQSGLWYLTYMLWTATVIIWFSKICDVTDKTGDGKLTETGLRIVMFFLRSFNTGKWLFNRYFLRAVIFSVGIWLAFMLGGQLGERSVILKVYNIKTKRLATQTIILHRKISTIVIKVYSDEQNQ